MRKLALLCVVILVAGVVSAQVVVGEPESEVPPEERYMTRGEFAVLVLKMVDTLPDAPEDPVEALLEVKRLELVPQDWRATEILTKGDLADVLEAFGATYQPANRDEPVTRAFAEVTVRRQLTRLKDYLARRMGHGLSTSHILDEGVDRAVSPIYFE